MSEYRRAVEAAIRATDFHSPTAYSWFGRRSAPLPAAVRRVLTAETARSYLHLALQTQLYREFYCPGHAQSTREQEYGHQASGKTPFVEDLAAANSSVGYWATGWEVRAEQDGHFLVHKNGLTLRAHRDDCVAQGDDPVAAGAAVKLRFPREFLALSPGFYLAHGNSELRHEEGQTIVRWYANLTPTSAIHFVGDATAVLNCAQLGFKLKVLNNPARFTRCDSVVLYTSKADHSTVSDILSDLYPALAVDIGPLTPMFTKVLAPGVGVAEDPGHGESFGLHRCGLLAEGMIRAYEQGRTSVEQRYHVVDECFAAGGVALDAPFLNSGSTDDYRLVRSAAQVQNRTASTDPREVDTENFLAVAVAIGSRLTLEAVWHDGVCNWLSIEPEQGRSEGRTGLVCRALGPDLYAGTSGVALFLAELHAATGDRAARDAALGAVRLALSNLESIAPLLRLGLYSGWAGIAFSAAWIGIVLGEEELLIGAREVVRRICGEGRQAREFDLLSGRAGAVAALVVLHDLLHDVSLLEVAEQFGNELIADACEAKAGLSWGSVAYPEQPNLTGLSHGASGVGYALLELFQATGNSEYRAAAELAFAYERDLFDEEAANWPDLRREPGQDRDYRSPLSFAGAWCHGAPGIALARLRAVQHLGDDIYRAEACTALATTREVVDTNLRARTGTYTLCHGLAGNADVLLHGVCVLGNTVGPHRALANDVACAGIERHHRAGRAWPCGPGGETPGLMTGLAGIGYFYLRMRDPELPSVLLPHRESPGLPLS